MRTLYYLSAMMAVLSFLSWNVAESANAVIAGSCNNAASGFCNEFTGSSYKAANVERSCSKQKLTYLAGACPTKGRVGSCLVYKGKNNESYYRYYASFPGFGIKPKGGVAEEAKEQCTSMKGLWIPN
jgi:hypothetical protein